MRNEHPDLSFGVTAIWPLYLDSFDGDPDLSVIQRTSVDPPGNWDFVNSMTYSSYVPPSWRAYYVYLVEQAMARLYPDIKPSHLIGLATQGQAGEPVLDFQDLVRDARLSRAMKVPEIVVYAINDRAFQSHGDDFIRQLADAVNDTQPDWTVEIPFSRPASVLVYGVAVADALLDARGWRGLFLMGWIILSGFLCATDGDRVKHKSNQIPITS